MEYTVAFLFYPTLEEVVMVRKERGPDPGCLNGLGGRIELTDACPTSAALREVYEESGITRNQLSDFFWLETVLKPNGNSVWYYAGVLKPGEDFVQPDNNELLERVRVSDARDVTNPGFAGRGDVCFYIHSALFEIGARGYKNDSHNNVDIECPHRIETKEGATCCAHLAEGRAFACIALTQAEYDALEFKCDYQYTDAAKNQRKSA